MRVESLEQGNYGWSYYMCRSAFVNDWERCLALVGTVYDCLTEYEIFAGESNDSTLKKVEIIKRQEIANIPEENEIHIKGKNKLYGMAPFEFIFYNWSDLVFVCVPTYFIKDLGAIEEAMLHFFDEFLDQVEITAATQSYESYKELATELHEQAEDSAKIFCDSVSTGLLVEQVKKQQDLNNKCAVMNEKEMREYIDNIGRAELFDELEDVYSNKYILVRPNNPHPYPRYLKAIMVSLVAQGYDGQWVGTEFRTALEKKYLKKEKKHES